MVNQLYNPLPELKKELKPRPKTLPLCYSGLDSFQLRFVYIHEDWHRHTSWNARTDGFAFEKLYQQLGSIELIGMLYNRIRFCIYNHLNKQKVLKSY